MQQHEILSGCADLLEGHRAFLDMLARLYYAPLSERDLQAINAFGLASSRIGNDEIERGLSKIVAYLGTGGTTLRQDINADYTAAFYGIVPFEGHVANPCESVFRSDTGLLYQGECQEVFRIYKREGIKKDDGAGVPEDHLSFELQFLSMMCSRAAERIRERDRREPS